MYYRWLDLVWLINWSGDNQIWTTIWKANCLNRRYMLLCLMWNQVMYVTTHKLCFVSKVQEKQPYKNGRRRFSHHPTKRYEYTAPLFLDSFLTFGLLLCQLCQNQKPQKMKTSSDPPPQSTGPRTTPTPPVTDAEPQAWLRNTFPRLQSPVSPLPMS